MNKDQQAGYPIYWQSGSAHAAEELYKLRMSWKNDKKRVITTNGCFDLIHPGHIQFLEMAANLGDKLIVGINSDRSVRTLKGEGKPLLGELERAMMLSALKSVDAVIIFDELLPNQFLDQIQPDIHCKAGDYSVETLPETKVVEKYGGNIHILPLIEGFSSSGLLNRIQSEAKDVKDTSGTIPLKSIEDQILSYLLSSSNLFRQSAYGLKDLIAAASDQLNQVLNKNNKILLCGNGGSAADSQHIAAELVGRFRKNRQALPAIALTTDTSILTAVANDYGFDQVFSRQIEALSQPGDMLIALSTSGESANVILAAETAKERGVFVLGLSGTTESSLSKISDLALRVPSTDTAMIQQIHIGIMHLLCDLAEQELCR